MRSITLGLAAATTLLVGCVSDGDGNYGGRPYYADQYYRDGPSYQERRLGRGDLIYRGRDDRYYCRRNDGTTGLIVGGVGGGVLGNIIAPGGSKTLGTILGAAGGALIGNAVEKDQNRGEIRCR